MRGDMQLTDQSPLYVLCPTAWRALIGRRKKSAKVSYWWNGGIDSPVLKDMPCAGRHAVDGPVGASLVIADGDAEPAVVGAHDLDELPGPAAHFQLLSLAGVASPDAGVVLSCNTTGECCLIITILGVLWIRSGRAFSTGRALICTVDVPNRY